MKRIRFIVVTLILVLSSSGLFETAFRLRFFETRTAQAVDLTSIIIAWPSTAASIPSGWTRVTALDTYYLEGTTSDPSVTAGGGATHTHTSPSHQHTIDHNHTGTTGAAVGSSSTGSTGGSAKAAHTHTITTGTNTDQNNAASANFGTASNDPPYTEVIWIKADNGTSDIPNGAWGLFNSDTLPTNWSRQSGNRFLKGAAGGGNGGGTGGSSDAHSHTDSGHTHTENAHLHTGTTDATATTEKSKGGSGLANSSHTHTISGGSTTATEQSGVAVLADGDGQPPFYKLNIIQNGTGSAETPDTIIAMWDGTVASIPTDWVLCNGGGSCPNLNDTFIKGANADSEIGTTGGAATHTHGAGTAHSHTIDSHTHDFTVNASSDTVAANGGGNSSATTAHTHTLSATGGGTTATQTATGSANSDNRPPYKEIVFIQYNAPVGGSLTLTASSTNSFDSAVTLSFASQTSTMSNAGAIQAADDRGGAPGWTLSASGADWKSGEDVMQLDYDGTGSDGNLGKLCIKPNNGTLYAETGSLTGVSKGSLTCYSASITSITILNATNGNGTGIYWLTDMPAEQFFPSSPTVASYTTTIVLTLS